MRTLPDDAVRLARHQDSILTAAQLLDLGVDVSLATRRVGSGRWQRPYPAVYVIHSGPLTWRTRARAGLLYAGRGAALSHRTAAYLHRIQPAPPREIEVSIPATRRVTPAGGLRIHLRRTMPDVWGPLRCVNGPDTVLDLLGTARTTDDAVGLICMAVRTGVHPQQILGALARRPRARHRGLTVELLGEAVQGIESPLEHRYHHDVERRHGLPRATLQRRQNLGGLWIRADRVYEEFGVRIELDGEIAHPGGRTDRDVWRDNTVMITLMEITLRYRWRHVAVLPCQTAGQVATALRARGWTGATRPCSPDCPVAVLARA